MTIGKSWPCRDCENHTPTCHGSCGLYNGEKQRQQAEATPIKTRKRILNDYVASSIEMTRGGKGLRIKNYRPKGRG